MKKFFIVLLCVILCVVVSCKTPKVTTGSNDAGETQSLEHVDSADAFDGADLTPAPGDEGATSEVSEGEVSESEESEGYVSDGEVSESEVSESEVSEVGEEVGFDDTHEEVVVENPESSSIESVDEVESPSETPSEDASEQETEAVEVETIESSDLAEVSEQTESTESFESFEEPVVEMEDEPAVEVQNSESTTQVPSSTPVVSSTMSSNINLAKEVPTGFVDKVIYFVKNNILISIGLLSIAIGVIWLFIDLIKFIVKSIKSNYSDDDEDFESSEEVKEIRDQKIENSNSNSNEDNEKHKFQDEDEFLRSLLNTEDL